MRAAILVGVIAAMAAGAFAAGQDKPPTNNDEVGVETTSNMAAPALNSTARSLRLPVSKDPASRVEPLSQTGRTTIEMADNGHRVSATIEVVKNTHPDILLGIGGSGDTMSNMIQLRVDGCEIDMPPTGLSFTDPRAISLRRHGRAWAFEITNNGDSEAYTATYVFNARTLVSQHLVWGGSYDANWRIKREQYGARRDCAAVRPRRFGARAEIVSSGE